MAIKRVAAIVLLCARSGRASVARACSSPFDVEDSLLLLQSNVASNKETAFGEAVEGGSAADSAEVEYNVNTPAVQQLWRDHYQHIDLIAEYVHKFESLVGEFRNSSLARAEHLKAHFESEFNQQSHALRALHKVNKLIQTDVAEFRETNSHLRAEADVLQKANAALIADLQVYQANFTLVQEFLDDAVNQSTWRLDDAPEVEVLKELAEQDAALHESAAHKEILHELAKGLSLLQLGGRESVAQSSVQRVSQGVAALASRLSMGLAANERDPKKILQFLAKAVEDWEVQTNKSETELNQTFSKMLLEGEEKREQLLQKQGELNSTKADALELRSRLETAVASLQKTRDMLQSRAEALRSFSLRLGESPIVSSQPQHGVVDRHAKHGDKDAHRRSTKPSAKHAPKKSLLAMDSDEESTESPETA